MMYDEYPDRVSMLLICDRIEKALAREDAERRAKEEADRGSDMRSGANADMRSDMRPGANADMRNDMGAGMRPDMETGEDMNAMDMRRRGRGDRDDFRFDRGRRNLLEVLLFNEMHKRRCKRRQCRRFW